MKKLILSILFVVCFFAFYSLTKSALATAEAKFTVEQIKDSTVTYSLVTAFIRSSWTPVVFFVSGALFLYSQWSSELKVLWVRVRSTLPLLALFVIGCGPARVLPLEMVGPNETAFVIPLEGDSAAQAKFESVEFLNKHKVVSKRIEIPVRERSIGRAWYDYEWIPTVRVVKVDRSLVTREWSPNVKDSKAVAVQSVDSIGFHAGVNLTAFIVEEDAAKYLYFHNIKPLSEVVDQNVRGYLQDKLSAAFGVLKLEECKLRRAEIFKAAEQLAIEHFRNYGITISNVGNAGGLDFDDERIQAAINDTANAEMSIQVATKQKLAQDERNKQIVATATAEADAAREFMKAKEAQEARVRLEIEKMNAQARLKWDGVLPKNILPAGSPLLMDFK